MNSRLRLGIAAIGIGCWLGVLPLGAASLVSHDALWRYQRGTGAPQANWKTAADSDLDDSWLEGPGGFGYADSSPETVHCRTLLEDMKGLYTTVYFRKVFTVDAPSDPDHHLFLTMDWDDGFVAWLDGRYVAGANNPDGTNEPPVTATASRTHEHSASTDAPPNPPVTYDLGPARLGPGDHVLAVMGLNGSRSSRDFVMVADLTQGRPPTPLTIEGVEDRRYGAYTDQVSFRVPAARGYTYQVQLDGEPVPADVTHVVSAVDYHELDVSRTNVATGDVTNRLVRFIVRSSERSAKQSVEDGLPPWTPWPVIPSSSAELEGASLQLLVPSAFPSGHPIPVVVRVVNDQGSMVRANGWIEAGGQEPILIKRGVGSGFLRAGGSPGPVAYIPRLRQVSGSAVITIEGATDWRSVSGTLDVNTAWPAGSRIAVTGDLTLPAAGVLTIGEGTVVRLDPGVNLHLDGRIEANGTVQQPIVFMPSQSSQPWGGFFLRTAASEIRATGTLFTGSGADPAGTPDSHRREQSLFHCSNGGRVTLTDCAAIALKGQLGHSVGVDGAARYFFTFERFLMQGGCTGGEYEDAVFAVNDSAFVDCHLAAPPFPQFSDNDEDGLYLKNIPAGYTSGFTNTLIGWVRDDGVDSGASGGGELHFQNCWFEAVYHEANSLSGTGKNVRHSDGVFLGCGQALETGYGSPRGTVEGCLVAGGVVGVRFGDNYDWSYDGRAIVTNSILIHNHRDVWGMNWQDWTYRVSAMDIRSNWLSAPNPLHPANRVWDPAREGWRLASFMGTRAGADVGLGFAVWTTRLAMPALFEGVPVGLSTFTTNAVSVGYAFVSAAEEIVATGTLVFAPGEIVKRIPLPPAGLGAGERVRVVLRDPVGAELTGETVVDCAGTLAPVEVSLAVARGQLPAYRSVEGLAIRLSGPSTQPVSVKYQIDSSDGVLVRGTAVFLPGELMQHVEIPAPEPGSAAVLRVTLLEATHAVVGGFGGVYYLPDSGDQRLIAWRGVSGGLQVGWWESGGVLERATDVLGPWEGMADTGAGPVAVPATAACEFFRLRIP
ncbi:MAG TPA: hypothetical protein PKM73_02440 [Verrucomicrobiota bacterium]|nr:hypothetical protein [Verrucomicrobiota bacterium]HNU49773.1 hypothetical protein [Verrucomicrobiota bacterium]